jgi:type VI secretion system secreted protein VgrG
VTSLNSTRNTIRSAGGNTLEMQDMAGMERVLLSTPHEDTYLHLGAPTNPRHEAELRTRGNVLIRADKNLYVKVGKKGKKVFNYEKTVKREGNLTLTENICQGNYKKTIENTGTRTENIGPGNYEKKVENTGKLTEKIPDQNPNYDRTVLPTGDLTEKICTDRYERHIDPDGNLTEEIKGSLNISADQGIKLKANTYTKEIKKESYWNTGSTDKSYGGHKSGIMLGSHESLNVGNKTSVMAGAQESINVVEKLSFVLGFQHNINLGVLSKFAAGWCTDIKLGPVRKAAPMEIKDAYLKIDKNNIKLGDVGTNITRGLIHFIL